MVALLGRLDRTIQRAGLFGRVRYIQPIRYTESSGTVRAIYDQILAEYGLGGPYFVLSVSAPLLAAFWNLTRVSMLWGLLPRGQAEIIAATVATEEACPFCVDVHTEMASAAGERSTAARLARHDWTDLARHTHENDRLAVWVKSLLKGDDLEFPLDPNLKPYAISVTLLFVYITSLVTIFQQDGLVAGGGGSRLLDRMVKLYMRTSLGLRVLRQQPLETPTPGLANTTTELPDGYAFASPEPALARAWGWLDKAVDEAGRTLLSEPARQTVDRTLEEHDKSAASLDLRFLDAVLDQAPEAERGAVRLAVVAGLAPYRVVEADLKRADPGDDRGERWVALVSLGVRARLIALVRKAGAAHAQVGVE